MAVFKIWPENTKKAFITLQALRLKLKLLLNGLNHTSILSKSKMQLYKSIFSDSANFVEKKTVENQLLAKSKFLWQKKCIILVSIGMVLHFEHRLYVDQGYTYLPYSIHTTGNPFMIYWFILDLLVYICWYWSVLNSAGQYWCGHYAQITSMD